MAQCPFIADSSKIDRTGNKPIIYKTKEGDYTFFDHDDGHGEITRVQFCELVGRKRDVFECLNENEWKKCPYFLSHPSPKYICKVCGEKLVAEKRQGVI